MTTRHPAAREDDTLRDTWGYKEDVFKKRGLKSFHLLNGRVQDAGKYSPWEHATPPRYQAHCGMWIPSTNFIQAPPGDETTRCPGCSKASR